MADDRYTSPTKITDLIFVKNNGVIMTLTQPLYKFLKTRNSVMEDRKWFRDGDKCGVYLPGILIGHREGPAMAVDTAVRIIAAVIKDAKERRRANMRLEPSRTAEFINYVRNKERIHIAAECIDGNPVTFFDEDILSKEVWEKNCESHMRASAVAKKRSSLADFEELVFSGFIKEFPTLDELNEPNKVEEPKEPKEPKDPKEPKETGNELATPLAQPESEPLAQPESENEVAATEQQSRDRDDTNASDADLAEVNYMLRAILNENYPTKFTPNNEFSYINTLPTGYPYRLAMNSGVIDCIKQGVTLYLNKNDVATAANEKSSCGKWNDLISDKLFRMTDPIDMNGEKHKGEFYSLEGIRDIIQKISSRRTKNIKLLIFTNELVARGLLNARDCNAIDLRRECLFFGVLAQDLAQYGYSIIRELPICSNDPDNIAVFRIDGYIKGINLAIEYDEEWHLRSQEDDISRRDSLIRKTLNCDIIHVPASKCLANDIDTTMHQIKQLANIPQEDDKPEATRMTSKFTLSTNNHSAMCISNML